MDLPVQTLNLIWCECVICVGSVRCPSPTPRTLKNSRDAYIKKLNEIYLRNLEKVCAYCTLVWFIPNATKGSHH